MLAGLQITAQPRRPELPPLRAGSAAISGHVIDAFTEKPVVDVEVRLMEAEVVEQRTATSISRLNRTALARTGANGEFSFSKIAAGSYRIIGGGRTHLTACYGSSRQSSGPCLPIDIEDGQERRNADVYVRPAAIIKGRILDHDGEPTLNGTVRVTSIESNRPAGMANPVQEGRFEIGGLASGQVLLSIELMGKRNEGLVHAYYPGVLQLEDAVPLSIEAGTTTEVDIRIPRVVVGAINARVSGPDGFRLDKLALTRPETKTHLTLTREDDGIARVINLRGGRYIVEARGSVNGKPLAAFATADVADGALDVAVDLAEAGSIVGRFVAERGGLPPLGGVRIAAVWMLDGVEVDPFRPDEMAVGSDGAFSFTRLFGTRALHVIGLDAGWKIVSIRTGRSELAGNELEVTSGSRTELTITVGRR